MMKFYNKQKAAVTVWAVALLAAVQVVIQVLDSSIDERIDSQGTRMLSHVDSKGFDPKSVAHMHFTEAEGIKEDGTYLLLRDVFNQGPYGNCMALVNQKDRIKRVHYHFNYCSDFDNMFGNRLGLLYGIKMVAHAMGKPFTFTCGLAEDERPNGSAFFMDLNSDSDEPGPVPNRNGEKYTAEDVCQKFCEGHYCNWHNRNLDLASDIMIEDWKQLSSSDIVSITDDDDAVIHLRLGDGLYSTFGDNEGKGIFPHATYVNLLKQAEEEKGTISSIGILTAPFKGSNLRVFDQGHTSKSEMIAKDLITTLQQEFPAAQIRLHNSPNDTIIETLARLVNARKAAICGASTFCPYALLASKAIGFMYNPVGNGDKVQNIWVRNAADRYANFRLFETPMLNGLIIDNQKNGYKLPDGSVLRWLREQDPKIGNVDITEGPIFRRSKEN